MEKNVPLMTVLELAAWLNLKESTIRKWVCYRKIPYISVGRAVRFRREDIEEWLKDRSISPVDFSGQRKNKEPTPIAPSGLNSFR